MCTTTMKRKIFLSDFSEALEKHFTRVKSYLVGPGARKLLSSGTRLTKDVNSPKEFDLAI